jgi:CheY-like chemotaxis protein
VSINKRVLLIDDRVDDISWLVDDLSARGCEVHQVTNEKAARQKLHEVREALDEGEHPVRLAIVDIMIPVMDILELVDIDDDFFEDSAKSGVRLCRYARKELKITEEDLPILSLTARSDDMEIRKELNEIGIQGIFGRMKQNDEEGIREYLGRILAETDS